MGPALAGPFLYKMYTAHIKSRLQVLFAILIAAFLFTQWGYFWYAMLLDDVWQSLIGKSELELIHLAEQRGVMQSISTHLISLVQAAGLFFVLFKCRSIRLLDYIAISFGISMLLIVPSLGNAVLFAGQSSQLWILDSGHFVFGYLLMGSTFWLVGWLAKIYKFNASAPAGAKDPASPNTWAL